MSDINKILKSLKCPISKKEIFLKENKIFSGDKEYLIDDDIFRFIKIENLNVKTNQVLEFYLKDPFPNYKDFDTLEVFISKMKDNYLMQSIKDFIKPGFKVLEFGSGTCQLGNYLAATTHAEIFCADLSYNSLSLGSKFVKNIVESMINRFKSSDSDQEFDR